MRPQRFHETQISSVRLLGTKGVDFVKMHMKIEMDMQMESPSGPVDAKVPVPAAAAPPHPPGATFRGALAPKFVRVVRVVCGYQGNEVHEGV